MAVVRFSQIVLIFIFSFSIGFAIKCFQCNSAENSTCGDLAVNDTNSPFYNDCTGPNNQTAFCRKVYSKITSLENSERITRTCGWIMKNGSARTDQCKKGDTDFLKRTSCICFSDACNASEKVGVASVNLAVISIIFVFSYCLF